mmetsp:Transcript_21888/g.36066  ORF Transcript_21888/g.36066 Transcript_21888/m.36066 type:complete len:302 (-) Transcript_21888:151-1056(-)
MHLGGTLEKTRVEVENVTRVGLTSRRTTEKQGHLTVGNSLLGEIVIKDHSMLPIVTKVFSHSGTSVGSQELKRSGVGSSCGNDNAVVHGLLIIELTDKLSNGGSLLSNTNVNTGEGILLGLLVNNGVNSNGSLTSLTITNNQLTLTTSNGDKSIHSLKPGKHRLGHRLTRNNSWGLNLSTRALAVVQTGAPINGLSNTINNTSQKLRSDGNIHNGTGTLHGVSLKNITIVAENNNSHIVLFQVKSHPAETAGKHNHLSSLDIGKSVNTGNTISYGNNGSGLGILDSGVLSSCSADFGLKVR